MVKENLNFLNSNKKTISPVVGIALLLVVSVVTVVGFQIWFQTYQSVIFSNIEIESNSVQDDSLKI